MLSHPPLHSLLHQHVSQERYGALSFPYPIRLTLSDAFPSSAAFDAINVSLQANEADRADAIKKGAAIFAFKLKNSAGQEESWHIDLKTTGTVAKGEAPAGKKADVVLSLSDENFGKMVSGKTMAQQLFMSGKLKIKGNVMKGESLCNEETLHCSLTRITSDEDGADIGEGEPAQGEVVDDWKEKRKPIVTSIIPDALILVFLSVCSLSRRIASVIPFWLVFN